MTVARLSAPTLFGKLPTQGDFVVRGERGIAERAFAEWLIRAVEAARGKVPTEAARFVARPVQGPTLLGCWVASRDVVGRDFPLVASCRVPGSLREVSLGSLLVHCEPLQAWVASASTAAPQRGVEAVSPTGRDLTTLSFPSDHGSRAQVQAPEPAAHPSWSALATTHLHELAAASFAHVPLDNLRYALSVLQRAVRLRNEVTLEVPASSERALFVWLELLRGFMARENNRRDLVQARDDEPSLLLWLPALRRALVCLDAWPTELLVYLGDAQHQGHGLWPLWSERREARELARSELDPATLDCIDRDDTVAALLALVKRGAR